MQNCLSETFLKVAVCRTEDTSVIEFKGLFVKIGGEYTWFRII